MAAKHLIVDHLPPAVLIAAFSLVQLRGWLRWLPVDPRVEAELGPYALLLGVVVAVVTSSHLVVTGLNFRIAQFLFTVGVVIAMMVPAILTPSAAQLHLPPDLLGLVSRVAYLGFFVANGILFGSAWGALLTALRIRAAMDRPEGR